MHLPGIGVDLQLTGLTRGDTGTYKCTVNVHKKAIDITHMVGFMYTVYYLHRVVATSRLSPKSL